MVMYKVAGKLWEERMKVGLCKYSDFELRAKLVLKARDRKFCWLNRQETFVWAEREDYVVVPDDDIVKTLDEPLTSNNKLSLLQLPDSPEADVTTRRVGEHAHGFTFTSSHHRDHQALVDKKEKNIESISKLEQKIAQTKLKVEEETAVFKSRAQFYTERYDEYKAKVGNFISFLDGTDVITT
uniref:Uncharacterized protein n=1 Tax=Timema bartmani TaxID=61472 RepID=A0A7R9F017_9NEOP|nr:unnamed protein product [Timema bartmani]